PAPGLNWTRRPRAAPGPVLRPASKTPTYTGRSINPMETAITLVNPPALTLAEDEKGQLSALVQIKLEETKTLTLVSTDDQFEAAGEQLKAIALLRERIKGTLKPFLEFWHQGHKAHTGLLATLDGPLEARERFMKQGLARYQKEKEGARRREEE